MSSVFHDILRAIASAMEVPVVIGLILFIAFTLFSIGWWAVEYFRERRHMQVSLPALLDQLRAAEGGVAETIEKSGLLRRQKDALPELTKHPDFDAATRESLGANLLEREQSHYDGILKCTDLVSKLAPMLGLMGTLIPLGPGIMALGQGDTYTLSVSLLTAFDTTIAGLIAAAFCLVISTVRRRWYSGYMADLETLMDCALERESAKWNDCIQKGDASTART